MYRHQPTTLRCVCVCVCAVSYTHLDVYKRQEYGLDSIFFPLILYSIRHFEIALLDHYVSSSSYHVLEYISVTEFLGLLSLWVAIYTFRFNFVTVT